MRMIRMILIACGILAASLCYAQKPEGLETFFEGRMVELKLDMPATKDGVDVYPLKSKPVDFTAYADRIKEHGTAIKSGERMMITKIKAKEKHIEFQLGGGGYGTLGDESDYVDVKYAEKSKREKELEKLCEAEKDKAKKKDLQRELDDLRETRERENARLKAEADQIKLQKQAMIREKALTSGSRFNIRYEKVLTASELTPESIMKALGAYVVFPADVFGNITGTTQTGSASATTTIPAPTPSNSGELKKGLTWQEVSSRYGIPKNLVEKQFEKLNVVTCTFETGNQRIETTFVEEVLVKYSVMSK